MPEVRERDKELRFTRSGQAVGFWIAAAVCAIAAMVLFAVSVHRQDNPGLPHPAWSLPPVLFAYALARLAVRLTRHAYLILTPLGIEIFPFLRPAHGMQSVYWSEIDSVEVNDDGQRLTLHFNAGKSSGIHLSLRPVDPKRRDLLLRAVEGRMTNKSSPAGGGSS